AIGRRDLDVERLAYRDQWLGDRPGHLDRAVQMRVKNRAAVDRNNVVRTGRRIADLEHVVRSYPPVQGDAPAARAMGIDQGRDVAIDSRLRQRRHHKLALPGAIGSGVPVLDRAAAADAEMRTERRDPLHACGLDLEQSPAVGMVTGNRTGLYCFTAQRERHVDVAAAGDGDAVAVMADMIDDEALAVSHGARP